MSLQFSTTYRNAMLDQLATTLGGSEKIKIFTGGPPSNCGAGDTGTQLVEYDLASSGDWSAASSGQKTLASLTLTATASATGTAGYFRMYDSGSSCHLQGTITATSLGGDMTLDNVSISASQTVNLTGFTLTAPGA